MIEKMDGKTVDIVQQNIQELERLFPEAVTEGKVDFDRLRLVLGDEVERGKERYEFIWPGKSDCIRLAQQQSTGTLRPDKESSVNWDTTKNIFIEGDNLEVLRLLQKAYHRKVKMIYIDPPYNTGNDFIYPDNYTESLRTYLEYTGQIDAEGRRFGTNSETDGRFHSKWLNMMYPRLFLARNLLRDDGIVFISINDNEVDNLKKVCNEIFGEENFIACLIWEKGRKNDAKLISVGHEYIVVFAKSKATLNEDKTVWRESKPGAIEIQIEYERLRAVHGSDNAAIQLDLREFYNTLPKSHPSKKLSRYGNVDDYGVWRDDNMSWPGGGGPRYDVIHPITKKACAVPDGGWRYSTLAKMLEMIEKGKVVFREDHTEPPIRKTYLVRLDGEEDFEEYDNDDVGIQVAGSYFYRSAIPATRVIMDLFDNKKVFDNPKDHEVLLRWIRYVGSKDKDDIVLDFFAGSGTVAHSIMELNKSDGGSRRYILVQLPEPLDPNNKDQRIAADFCDSINKPRNIAEICKERIRRSADKIGLDDERAEQSMDFDIGFRAFKLDSSNLLPWDPDAEDIEATLTALVDPVKDNRCAEDVLFEIMIKYGIDLAMPIEEIIISGKRCYSVGRGYMMVCLDQRVTLDVVEGIAALKPERVVFKDMGFADDNVKTNAVQLLTKYGIEDFRSI